MKTLLHPATKRQLLNLKPGQSYLFTGPASSGKHTAALELAEELCGASSTSFQKYIYTVVPQKNTIGVAQIHELRQWLQLRADSPGQSRVVIIKAAQHLTPVAQNAFLKTLEEPPRDVTVIMTSPEKNSLLLTILSRCQIIHFLPVKDTDLTNFLEASSTDKAAIAESVKLAAGITGKAISFLRQPEAREHAQNLQKTVAQFRDGSLYERLIMTVQLAQEEQTEAFIEQLISFYRLHLRSLKTANTDLSRYALVLEACAEAQTFIAAHVNKKLALDKLALELEL